MLFRSPFSSRLPPAHCLNDGDFAPNRHFRHFLIPNRPRTTWCVVADGGCSALVLMNKDSNGCKSRPVFSLVPFSSRLPPSHCLYAGDFAPNRHFRHFLTPNRPRTIWSVQRHDVWSGLLLLNKGSNGCKSRPVFSLFPFSCRLPPGHCLNVCDFGQNRHFGHFLTPNRPRTTWSVERRDVCSGLVVLNKSAKGCK